MQRSACAIAPAGNLIALRVQLGPGIKPKTVGNRVAEA